MGLMALTWRRPAEIFFSASFSLPQEKLPFPALLFDGQLKTRQAPSTSFEPYPIPVLGDPKKIIQALDRLIDSGRHKPVPPCTIVWVGIPPPDCRISVSISARNFSEFNALPAQNFDLPDLR
jgi:hypothetical protein